MEDVDEDADKASSAGGKSHGSRRNFSKQSSSDSLAHPSRPGSRNDGKTDGKPASGLEITPLWRALQDEDWESVKVQVKKPEVHVNLQDECFGWNAGHFAANAGMPDVLKILLDVKAKIDQADNEGNTMLMLASRRGHLKAAELLIGKKANVDGQNKNGWTALTWVGINGHEALAHLLLQSHADLMRADCDGRTPTMWAARHGKLDIVEVFLCSGVNLRIRDNAGLTVLDHCQEHMGMAATILAVGEINDSLHQAAQMNDVEGAKAAIESGADVDLRDDNGWTPLMWAALHGSLDMLELVIRYGAKPSLLDESGHIVEGLQTQHLTVGEEVEKILGANDRLLEAATNDDWQRAEEELSIGAFINMRDDDARTSLMWAAKHCNADAVHMLLDRNANVNDRDSFGWAAVHFAVIEKSAETVSMFHYLGADMQVKTYEGDGLLHMAVRANDAVMIQLLIAAGLDTEDMDVNLFTPLMMASYHGLHGAVNCLIAYAAKLDAKSTVAFGARGALSLAVVHGQEEAVATLLQPVQPPPKMPGEVEPDPPVGEVKAKVSKRGPTGVAATKRSSANAGERGSVPVDEPAGKSGPTPKAKAAASGVAARKKVAQKAELDIRGTSPEALLQEAIRLRSEKPWTNVPNPARVVVKETDISGATPLALAVRYKRTAIGTMLLQAKADPNAADDRGTTVLMEAVLTRQTEVVEYMVALGAKVEKQDKEGRNAIDLCEDETIRQLLYRKITMDQIPDTDQALIDAAAEAEAQALFVLEQSKKYFRIRIEGLPHEYEDHELEQQIRGVFMRRGAANPKRVRVLLDPITERPRGHAYADFLDAAAQDLAMIVNGEQIYGCPIRVCKEPRRPH